MKVRKIKTRAMLRRAVVLDVQPGDLLVVKMPYQPSSAQMEGIQKRMKQLRALRDVDLLLLNPGTTVKVIRPKDDVVVHHG